MAKTIDGIIYSDDMKSVEGVADKSIKRAVIKDGVRAVVMKAFADCTALEEVSIPNSMFDIKKSSFKNCTSLLTVRLADNVEYLSSSWFTSLPERYEIVCESDCETFKLIKRSTVLKAHVKTLSLTEAKSEKIKKVQCASIDALLSSALEEYSDSEFKILSSRKSATSALIRIGKNCGVFRFGTDSAKWMPKVPKIIEILSDQDKDGSVIYAEIKANKLTLNDMASSDYIYINSDVNGNLNLFTSGKIKRCCKIQGDKHLAIFGATSIGDMQFYNGLNFETLTLGDGLEDIGSDAFYNCESLKSVTFPEGLQLVCSWAFYGCTSLTSIHLPESLRCIGDSAFRECTSLCELHIPKTLNGVDKDVFKDSNIQNLGYSIHSQHVDLSNRKVIDYDFTIKDGFALENDSTLLYGSVKSENVTIFDGITKINTHAFYACHHIKRVFIPKSVKEIGSAAFEECSALSEIEFGGTRTQWRAIEKGQDWCKDVPAKVVKCSDGDVELEYKE